MYTVLVYEIATPNFDVVRWQSFAIRKTWDGRASRQIFDAFTKGASEDMAQVR
jgi:hypothetical protein